MAKFYLFAQNYEKWRSNFYIFTPNYEKLRSKVAKISKKREKRGWGWSKFYKKIWTKTGGWILQQVEKGGSVPRSLHTNFTYAVPPPREWLNACHIPPRGVSKTYRLSRVSSCHLQDYICPTDQFNFDGRKDFIVFQTGISELSHLSYYSMLVYRNLLSITSCRSLEFSFLLQLMTSSLWYMHAMEYSMVLRSYSLVCTSHYHHHLKLIDCS